MSNIRKKTPLVFFLSVLSVILLVRALDVGVRVPFGAGKNLKKSRGLESFLTELKSLGFEKGDGGAILFRRNVINPLCREAFLRIYVASAPHHVARRRAIRDTWATWIQNVTVIFVIGRSDSDIVVAREAEKYGDILQGDFNDSYDNLVFKSASMLTHFTSACSAQYLLKTDDDVFVNVPVLAQFLTHHQPQGIVGCDKSRETQPMGSSPGLSKMRTTPPKLRPITFVAGAGYVIEKRTAFSLKSGCLLATPIPVEDMYITSRCAQNVGLKPVHHSGFSCGRRLERPCEMKRAFTGHHVTARNMVTVFRALIAGACEGPPR